VGRRQDGTGDKKGRDAECEPRKGSSIGASSHSSSLSKVQAISTGRSVVDENMTGYSKKPGSAEVHGRSDTTPVVLRMREEMCHRGVGYLSKREESEWKEAGGVGN